MSNFNERLRSLREDNNLTQIKLANFLFVDQRSISFYEIGKYEPNLETLKRIALFFNVSSDYLLGLTDNKVPYPKQDASLKQTTNQSTC